MLRSVGAVVAGIVTLTVVSFAIEGLQLFLLPASFNDSVTGMALIVAYTAASAGLGGYVTARIAGRMAEVTALLVVQLVFGLVVYLQMPDLSPPWVWTSMTVLGAAALLLGGVVAVRKAGA